MNFLKDKFSRSKKNCEQQGTKYFILYFLNGVTWISLDHKNSGIFKNSRESPYNKIARTKG